MSHRVAATIQSIMDAKGYSARDLAKMLGWSPSTLSKKLSGDLKIRRTDREEIAAVLGTTADAIDQLAGVPFSSPPKQAKPKRDSRIPLINRAAAGAFSQFDSESESANGYADAMNTIDRGTVEDADAFAVVVDGESMQPTLLPGDIVVFSPAREGDDRLVDGVVVHIRSTPESQGRGGNLIGRWFMDHDRREVVIRKDNPRFPPVILSATAYQDIARIAIAAERRTRAL